jgi:FlaA1/EpsC-like NDP-sugar epimerase
MYWLSVISSVTGIISFVISFFDYFKKWKNYLLYVACCTIGLTIGVLLSMSEKTVQQFTQSQLIYLIAFVCIISLLILFIYRYLTHTNDPFFIAILVIVGVSYFSVRLLNSVEGSQSFIKNNDYLILSNHYIIVGDHTRAADFLKKYRDMQAPNLPDRMLDSIDKRVDSLYYKGFNHIR